MDLLWTFMCFMICECLLWIYYGLIYDDFIMDLFFG